MRPRAASVGEAEEVAGPDGPPRGPRDRRRRHKRNRMGLRAPRAQASGSRAHVLERGPQRRGRGRQVLARCPQVRGWGRQVRGWGRRVRVRRRHAEMRVSEAPPLPPLRHLPVRSRVRYGADDIGTGCQKHFIGVGTAAARSHVVRERHPAPKGT